MQRIQVKDIKQFAGQEIELKGFVHNVRDLKKVQFVILRDRTGLVQLFIGKDSATESINNIITSLPREAVIKVRGKVNVDQNIKLNQVEIQINHLEIMSTSEAELPIDDTSPLNLLLDWRFLDLRQEKNLVIFEVQTTIEHAMREWWIKNDFIEIHSPKLMGTASESGAELFELPYFGGKAYLAQSPQFYKQMAMAAGFDKVFEIGPVFRANSSHTKRHDTEFTSVDVEISWVESHEDVMKCEEEWLAYVVSEVVRKHGKRIKEVYGIEIDVPTLPFPRMTLAEARDILAKQGHIIDHKADLDPEGERLIGEYVKQTFNHDYVFLTEYPTSVRAFYHMRPDANQEVTKSFDLLGKGLEITTGAQREHRPDILIKQALEKGYNLEPLKDYINFFKYGCPPHGGFGFGLTRLIMVLLNLESVRQATYIYRGPTRLTP
ncbi:MAG: aspartate--tRNA(Asn) ligase [Bacteroidetes bacterium]|nr:aspartate--tRNA(Asn) ligase [Bacteroidota bacterium]